MKSAIAFNLYRQRPELLTLHEACLLVADPEVNCISHQTHKVLERVHLDRRHFRASLKSKTSLRIEAPLYDYEYSFPPESEHERELSLAPIFFDLVQEQLRAA